MTSEAAPRHERLTEVVDAHCHILRAGTTWSAVMAEEFLQAGLADVPVWWDPSRTWTAADMDVDVDRLVGHMDDAGVGRSVVFGFGARPYGCHPDDAAIFEAVERHPSRFIPFHVVDPFGGPAARALAVKRVVHDGFQGLKMLPAYNHLALDDPRLYPVYALAEDLQVPLIVHTGGTRIRAVLGRWQDPLLLDPVGVAFPALRLWIAHCGMHHWADALTALGRHPAMAADVSYWGRMPVHEVARAMSWAKHAGVLERIFWGTDYPFWGQRDDIARWRAVPDDQARLGLDPAITQADVNGILGGNLTAFLGGEA
jgi:predicted TIM-barrel fold metal-dependent hydrolase